MATPRADFPGLAQATALGLGSFLLGALLLGGLLLGFRSFLSREAKDTLLLLHGSIAALIGLAVTVWYTRLSWRELVPLRPVARRVLLAVAISVLGGVIVLSEAVSLFSLLLPVPEWMEEMLNQVAQATPSMWTRILLIAVAPGIFEELFCRGVMLRGFLRRYSPGRAILYSSAVFAAGHFNPWQAITAITIGMYFGWLYYRTRSLIPSIFGHMLNNGIYVALSALPSTAMPGLTGDDLSVSTLLPNWLVLVGVSVTLLGLLLTRRALRDPHVPPI